MTGGPIRLWMVLATTMLLLSGCIAADGDRDTEEDDPGDGAQQEGPQAATSWSWSSGGTTTTDQSGTIEAPSGRASLSLSAGGEGQATLTITDGEGDVVYGSPFGGSGGTSIQESVTGAPGTWTIALQIDRWDGGISIQVSGQ